MTHISLDGPWRLLYFPEGQHPITHPNDLSKFDVEEITACVPGNVELDLCRTGVRPDPFYANHIRRLRAFEPYEWWYTREFEIPNALADQRWDLVFAGLDTLATVWINDIQVGQAANMLIPHRFAVTEALRPGQTNTLTVRLGSAVNYARHFHYEAATMSWEHREEGLYVRKAPHVWGWDIMPRAISAGIWRSVWLEAHPDHAIEHLYYWTAHIGAYGATLGVRYQIRTPAPTLDDHTLHFHGVCRYNDDHKEHTFDFTWPIEFVAGGCTIPIPEAKLWWPKGYGAPNLYTVTAQLCQGETILAERTERVGLRTIELRRTETAAPIPTPKRIWPGVARGDTPLDPDHHFVFVVNDTPVMVKGTNWVPLDAFHSRDAARVANAVALLDDLHCTMVRCWGGNVYEDDAFFDLCDERGMLVWQDFAFACCIYPQDADFLEQVRVEVQTIVEKLRNHPSLALWCGDNEIDMVHLSQGLEPTHNRLSREVIPQVVHRFDPHRVYLQSSPYLSPEAEATKSNMPEQHLWGPRSYFKSEFYTQHSAHFIGEIGYHGCPNVSTLKTFISPESLWPWQDNAEWQTHAVHHWHDNADTRAVLTRDRIALMASQIRELFGDIPEDLATFALASQITQAEAKKFFIESTRLRKWRTSGILWWNLTDGWPQFSDAIVDYNFGKKLAYHYIWRVQRPICVILGEIQAGKHHPIVICNDSRVPAEVHYHLWNAEDGLTLAEGTLTVPANQNWQAGALRAYAGEQRLILITWDTAGQHFGNHYISGTPPFSLARYRDWLPKIAALHRPFDTTKVAR